MALDGQTLTVNPEAIRKTLLHDSAFEDVTVNVAHPGESLRIVHVLDAVEPRVKTTGPGVALHGQTLTVNPEAIRKTLLHDSAFEDVTVNVAHPGESLRIVH